MRTYTYSEARQQFAAVLDQAKREGAVCIRRQDGSTFVLQPMLTAASPLDVPGVKSRLARGELVELLRSERERAGEKTSRRRQPPASK
jgi:hypothetical protein